MTEIRLHLDNLEKEGGRTDMMDKEILKEALRANGLSDVEIDAILQRAEVSAKLAEIAEHFTRRVGSVAPSFEVKISVYPDFGDGDEVKGWTWRLEILGVGEKEGYVPKTAPVGMTAESGEITEALKRLASLLGKELTEAALKYRQVYLVEWTKQALKKGLLTEDDPIVQLAKRSKMWDSR